jgi:lysophospholipase L1-like esterase
VASSIGNFSFVACSGGTVATAKFGNPTNNEQSQLNALDSKTALVTLSMGGNDAGFANVLNQCVAGTLSPGHLNCLDWQFKNRYGNTGSYLRDYLKVLVDNLGTGITCPHVNAFGADRCDKDGLDITNGGGYTVPRLADFYVDIHKKAPNARIAVLLYPHLFTTNPTPSNPHITYQKGGVRVASIPAQCRVGSSSGGLLDLAVGSSAITAMNTAVDTADQAIINEIALAKATGIDITPVDPRPAFDNGGNGGHGLCTDDPWVNTVSLNIIKIKGQLPSGKPRPESFHPNRKGQRAFASAILTALN